MTMTISILCANCHQHHDSVQAVKDCHTGKPQHGPELPATGTLRVPATDKQLSYLRSLISERPHWAEQNMAHVTDNLDDLTKTDASAWIGALKEQPKETKATPKATDYEAKRGDVHVISGTYIRIHIAQKSGNPYAAQATFIELAQWSADGSKLVRPGKVQWDYVPGLINKLSNDTKTTPEQAEAFGRMVGRCCFCSHAIDTPESVAAGYGPVCAAKYDLPWGDTTTEVTA